MLTRILPLTLTVGLSADPAWPITVAKPVWAPTLAANPGKACRPACMGTDPGDCWNNSHLVLLTSGTEFIRRTLRW